MKLSRFLLCCSTKTIVEVSSSAKDGRNCRKTKGTAGKVLETAESKIKGGEIILISVGDDKTLQVIVKEATK